VDIRGAATEEVMISLDAAMASMMALSAPELVVGATQPWKRFEVICG
jgi:hypothetical protein